MRNRDWLRNQNEYDLLLNIQKRLEYLLNSGRQCCILSALGSPPAECKLVCENCIQEWLSRERGFNSYIQEWLNKEREPNV